MALTTDLEHYYKFDVDSSTQTDEVGSANATVTGATFNSTGKINGDYSFTDDGITTSTFTTISRPLTINMWVKGTQTANYDSIFTEGSNYNNGMLYMATVSRLSFFASSAEYQVAATLSSSTYKMITITVDSSGNTDIYVDGVVQAKAGGSDTTNPSFSSLGFGKGWLTYDGFSGSMDEPAIWSRVLSSTEITELYNSGSGLQYPFSSGWSNTISGVSSPAAVSEVEVANITSVNKVE